MQSPLVGRAQDQRALSELLSQHRLVTLLGPAGMGKTALALQFADQGVFCDLTEADTLEAFAARVGASLGVPLTSGPEISQTLEQLGHALAARGALLLVLDNFEQLAHLGAPVLASWLQSAPELKLLLTSQERLKIAAERSYPLGPLQLPDEGPLESCASAQLFLQYAEQQGAPLTLTEQSRAQLRRLLRELDGIPLALQLAAAQMSVLSLDQLMERLDQRFEVLVDDRRDAPPRHSTLRAAFDWSWALLSEAEQSALSQSAAFLGSFSLDAAEAVLSLGSSRVIAILKSLKDKSLLRAVRPASGLGEVRYSLYLSAREYAAQKLEATGQREAVFARHAAYYLARCPPKLGIVVFERSALDRLASERENLIAIFNRGLAASRPSDALGALASLAPHLGAEGPYALHRALLDEALERLPDLPEDPLWVFALITRGRLHRICGDQAAARIDLQRAETHAEGALLAVVQIERANLLRLSSQAPLEPTERRYKDALSFAQGTAEHAPIEAEAVAQLGGLYCEKGRLDEALEQLNRAYQLHRDLGDLRSEGVALTNLGVIHQERGDPERARQCYERAIAIHQKVGHKRFEGISGSDLGLSLLEAGELEAARAALERAVSIVQEVGDRRNEGLCLGALAATLACLGQLETAQHTFEAAESILRADPIFLEAIATYRGLLDLALARQADNSTDPRSEDEATAHLERAQERLGSITTDETRAAHRVLEAALKRQTQARLQVAWDAAWFVLPTGERVDLEKRPKLSKVLAQLVEARLRSPGEPVSVHAIIKGAWPGERILPQAATNRVRVAVSSLRKAGLKDLIQTLKDGYQLKPSAPVERLSNTDQLKD